MPERPRFDESLIPAAEYDSIQARVPILCVDLLPVSPEGSEVGLIRRETYDDGEGWCMVGGAVKRNEPLLSAVARHVASTLGGDVSYELPTPQPHFVAEYFSEAKTGELFDPRKHAVALTYAAEIRGEPQPGGEALEFSWFARDQLDAIPFGFGQGEVVRAVLGQFSI